MSFPVSPINGQTTIVNGIQYTYSSSTNSWARTPLSLYTTSSTPPTAPSLGNRWYNTTNDVIYEYVSDGISTFWIDVSSPTSVPGGIVVAGGTISGNLIISSTAASTNANTGALIVTGGVGISNNININGNASIRGQINLNSQMFSSYTGANSGASIIVSGNNTIGGSGYFDFLKVNNITSTSNTMSFRMNSTGGLEIINSAYSQQLLLLDQSGNLNINGSLTMANRPAFRVIGTGASIGTGNTMSGTYWTVDYNQGGYLNSSTGIFTAPIAGLYQVNVVVRTSSNNNASINQIIIRKTAAIGGAVTAQIMVEFAVNTSMNHTGGSTIVKLAAGDTLKFDVTSGSISFDGNDNWSVAYIG